MGVQASAGGFAEAPLSRNEIVLASRQIAAACTRAGLPRSDVEDLVQDGWAWLIADQKTSLAREPRWLGVVSANFIHRFWRRYANRRIREGEYLFATSAAASAEMGEIESKEWLDHIAQLLPETERRILNLIRGGHTLAEATAILGVPRGSRAYIGGRLVRLARLELKRRSTLSANLT